MIWTSVKQLELP